MIAFQIQANSNYGYHWFDTYCFEKIYAVCKIQGKYTDTYNKFLGKNNLKTRCTK